ncbi:Rft protein [Ancylostoma ceylanicum]|uniref:Protein RFT1 homolog n=1 Tax=Ancylostoma ceylanicum TaxID=53326 RepID=A0A0D6LZ35_9BILA|nr:Rft protein [Ancylostoma ceylanicum]
MASLGRSLAVNFSGQLVARVFSFAINMYLLRIVNNDVLGLVNVRLTLLYNTVLFLTREPMRKANILRTSLPCFVNIIWLRFSLTGHFAVAQSLLILLQRVFVLVLITTTTMYHLDIFAYAQVLSSIAYLLFHYIAFLRYSRLSMPELSSFTGFRSFFPQPRHGFDREALSAIGTLFAHSILKQLMTDGSAYVMTFTELLSLKSQAVYDAVEKVGSLVARIVLTPLEEMCFAYFSNAINKNSEMFTKSTESHDSLVENFSITLHVASVIGIVVSVFGVPYSPLAVFLYGGHLLYDNGGVFAWKFPSCICGRTYSTKLLLVFIPERVRLHYCECRKYVVPNRIQVFGSTPGLSHTLAHVAIGGVLLVLVVAHICSNSLENISERLTLARKRSFIVLSTLSSVFRLITSEEVDFFPRRKNVMHRQTYPSKQEAPSGHRKPNLIIERLRCRKHE